MMMNDAVPISIGLFASAAICVVSWGGDNSVKTAALASLSGLAGWAGGVAGTRGHEARHRAPGRGYSEPREPRG